MQMKLCQRTIKCRVRASYHFLKNVIFLKINMQRKEINTSSQTMNDITSSKNQIIQTNASALKIPLSIQQRIKKSTRSQTSQSISRASESRKRKKRSIKSVAKSRFDKKQAQEQRKLYCTICQDEYVQRLIISLGNCQHRFCKPCLLNYTTFKINIFEEVYCPQEKCKETLSTNGEVFTVLDSKLRKKYQKIHHYEKIKKDEKLRLCPNENCQGVIQSNSVKNQPIQCKSCQIIFCPQCFLQKHQGTCDKYQILFYQAGLSFKQCQKCKRVVEKIAGCDHIKCICSYQFCYSCGRQWHHEHMCNKTPNVLYNYPCLNLTVKIIYIIGYSIFIYPLLMLSIIIQITLILLIALFVGILVEPIALLGQLCQKSIIYGILGILLFPILIVFGIWRVGYDLFSQSFNDVCSYDKFCSVCIMISDLFEVSEQITPIVECNLNESDKKINLN